jgi:hypothetical protein
MKSRSKLSALLIGMISCMCLIAFGGVGYAGKAVPHSIEKHVVSHGEHFDVTVLGYNSPKVIESVSAPELVPVAILPTNINTLPDRSPYLTGRLCRKGEDWEALHKRQKRLQAEIIANLRC